MGRITAFGGAGMSTTFSYDANGNRQADSWSEAGNALLRSYAVDGASNRVLSATHAASGPGGTATVSFSHTYDANGALTFDGRRRYAYDAEGRLVSSAPATGENAPVTRYAHNALGQRVFKTESTYPQLQEQGEQSLWDQFLAFFGRLWAPQTQVGEQLGWAFVYGEDGSLLAEQGMGGAGSTGATQHIWLPTPNGPMPIAVIVNGSKFAVHADHLNTPRRLTNEQGQVVWQWAYSAFGDEGPTLAANRFARVGEGAGTTNIPAITYNLRYPGQYADSESGLHYNYFRSYDPDRGGYTQFDPIGMAGGWNGYAYGDNSPLTKTDALGLQAVVPPVGPVPIPIPTPVPNMSPRPMDLSEPGGPTYTPGIKLPDLLLPPSVSVPLAILNWMCSEGKDYWAGLRPYRGKTKTNGESGRNRRYYEWDYTHGDVEVYDDRGNHLGSANPANGEMTKPPVLGRKINL